MNSIVKRNTFSILIFIVRKKTNNNGEHPIYCRLTVQGKSREFSTHHWVYDENWDPLLKKVRGNSENARSINNSINVLKTKLMNIRSDIEMSGKVLTAEVVVNKHLGKSDKKRMLIDVHKYYNEHHVKKLIGKDYAEGTYGRYKTSLDHVTKFIKFQYKLTDFPLLELDMSFATQYEYYLKTEHSCAHNTAIKYVKNLSAVINYARKQSWLVQHPFEHYQARLEKIDKSYLTEAELNSIESKEFDNPRLEEIRDIFVFCCYTGLPYADVLKLSNQDIMFGINMKKHINIKRTKTNVTSNIPLLDRALEILDKYKDHPQCVYSNKLLPVKSNQKLNAYLKEIATLCNCNKNLTTHIGRHTFATLMLTKGVSMEAVSSMLGHRSIKTTQIYGKIINAKVIKEMSAVNETFSNSLNTEEVKRMA